MFKRKNSGTRIRVYLTHKVMQQINVALGIRKLCLKGKTLGRALEFIKRIK